MEPERASRTTLLSSRLVRGDKSAADEVVPLVYDELRKLAVHHVGGGARGLEPTALVHEAWLRLVDQEGAGFETRRQFFALASKVMRSVLVDEVRAQRAQKRGGRLARITLDEQWVAGERDVDLLALHEALERLAAQDPELAEIVELRFFGGISNPESAELTSSSLRTVERNWRLARAFLHGELSR